MLASMYQNCIIRVKLEAPPYFEVVEVVSLIGQCNSYSISKNIVCMVGGVYRLRGGEQLESAASHTGG